SKGESVGINRSSEERARAYVGKIPGAISGQRGHDQTYSVAAALVNGFALSEGPALELMLEYNGRCEPPWSARELIHNMRSAMNSKHQKSRGHLLETGNTMLPVRRKSESHDSTPLPNRAGFARGTSEQLSGLAKSRDIGLPGVQLADQRGHLLFGKLYGID